MRRIYLIFYFLVILFGTLLGGWKYVEPPMPNFDAFKKEE